MAKITTITNPLTGQPTQVDQLEHTAQEIDDAIAQALPGGAIDVALQNKADTSSVYTKTETNTLLQNKLGGIESTDYPGCYYRMVGGVVEWVNPPMMLSKEYRTTERHLGKPVYVKTISIGALPNATAKNADTGISIAYSIVDRAVYSINPDGYGIVDMNRFALEDKIIAGGTSWIYSVVSTSDYSAYTKTYVTFKYAKD